MYMPNNAYYSQHLSGGREQFFNMTKEVLQICRVTVRIEVQPWSYTSTHHRSFVYVFILIEHHCFDCLFSYFFWEPSLTITLVSAHPITAHCFNESNIRFCLSLLSVVNLCVQKKWCSGHSRLRRQSQTSACWRGDIEHRLPLLWKAIVWPKYCLSCGFFYKRNFPWGFRHVENGKEMHGTLIVCRQKEIFVWPAQTACLDGTCETMFNVVFKTKISTVSLRQYVMDIDSFEIERRLRSLKWSAK